MSDLRLTHLKLAGFKSFVDPTTLHLHGQRVGIVGPNGCGKSNVIEAVRWVLGESSARELRGDSMQDVIFNGTASRKPVSRASVELHFDNSLGGAPGQWAEYAEIMVRRVLERDGHSSYYINHTQVRRRDVLDLFLGTGVGSRAYGIIGQNTISRIVEAKPEELRMFLEEAAGVSKYKERRHETELRLRDTRENLLRVEDIRSELAKRITELESQAEIAARYHQLKQRLDTLHSLMWLMKKRQAAEVWEKARKHVEKLANALEAEMASLRKAESVLEELRLQQSEAASVLQQAQGAFYEAGAMLSGAEQQLKHAEQDMERTRGHLHELATRKEQLERQLEERTAQLEWQRQRLAEAEAHAIEMQAQLEDRRQAVPPLEQACHDARQALDVAQAELIRHEQAIRLTMSNLQHQQRQLEQLRQKHRKLTEDLDDIVPLDMDVLQARERHLEQVRQQLTRAETEIAALQEQERAAQGALHDTQQALHEEAKRIAQLEAKAATLHKIQQALADEATLGDWLAKRNIGDVPRFWQSVRVQPGWETAVEHALGQRLNALVLPTLALAEQAETPPTPLVLCAAAGDPEGSSSADFRSDLIPLIVKVEPLSLGMFPVLNDWLAGLYVAKSYSQALARRSALAPGEMFVCPQGHLVSRTSVHLYAPGSPLHGVLERQRELEVLQQEIPAARQALKATENHLKSQQDMLSEVRRRLHEQHHLHKQLMGQIQSVMLEVQKLHQQRRHDEERRAVLMRELDETVRAIAAEKHKVEALASDLRMEQERLPRLRDECAQLRAALAARESARSQAQEALRDADRLTQQAQFSVKEIINDINEIEKYIKVLCDDISGYASQLEALSAHLAAQPLEPLKAAVHAAIELRHQREAAVAVARNRLGEIEHRLAEIERQRMQTEHQLYPLRDRLEQARLQEQEARLDFEHCAQALAGTDEDALAEMLKESAHPDRPDDVAHQIEALQHAIDELGAVNLAAIDQLNSERERARHLDSQAEDLNAAIRTLEEAIRRIDRETRGRLQHTYDEVNRNFSELFAALFDGGQARLELLGEEILDSGVQVFAQPPGKKNSTIHLLSGGEKALTAIALVFAMFRLNPAPFCLMDEVDAPLDDSNTERFCAMVRKMSQHTQFIFITHNKIAMEMAQQLIGVTMQESGVSRVVEVDVEEALRMTEEVA